MDPLSHAAFGRTLIGALTTDRPDRPLRGCMLAAVLGAWAPDLDLVVAPFGWDRYLRVHEIGTHTIAGTLACALLTAAVVRAFNRPTRYSSLAFAAWIGAASHVLLDLLSSARLRPAWPLLDTVVSLPAVAMADPWLLALSVAGAAAMSFWGRPAGLAILGLMAGFLLAKSALGIVAVSNYRQASDRGAEAVLARVIQAEWASLTAWRVFDRTADHVRFWTAGPGGADDVFSWPIAPESPPVTTSRSFSTVRNFLRAHQLGFAVTLPRGDGGTLVLWSDVRFCWDPSIAGARQLEPTVRSATSHQQIACALWFGGELDAMGRPRLEVVKVGGFTQTREPTLY